MAAHSPADILRHALVGAGVATLPSAAGAWPCYVGHLPADAADNALCVYDTTGRRDGRLMSGQSITHPGWQVKVRAKDHPTAWAKAGEVKTALDAIHNLAVAIAPENYTVAAVTQTTDVLTLGQEQDARRREQVTVNGTLTFT